MDFSRIVGQREVINTLKNAVRTGKVGHAYIFSGPKGIGKKTVAKIFAGMLLCTRGEAEGSCGSCIPCRIFEEGSNPDFFNIETEDDTIGVDEIREIQSSVAVRPMYSKKKVYLISDADKMTVQAQNCLLKTLEEPPEYTVIILTVSNYGGLLETIRSRTARYSFKANSPEEVRSFLLNNCGSDIKKLDFVVSYSNGILGKAMELANSEDFIALREKTLETFLKLTSSKLLYVFEAYSFFEANKGRIDAVLDIMLMFCRDLLVAKESGKENVLINSDKKDIIFNSVYGFSEQKLINNIHVIEEARRNISHNANYQLAIEVMLMKLQEENN